MILTVADIALVCSQSSGMLTFAAQHYGAVSTIEVPVGAYFVEFYMAIDIMTISAHCVRAWYAYLQLVMGALMLFIVCKGSQSETPSSRHDFMCHDQGAAAGIRMRSLSCQSPSCLGCRISWDDKLARASLQSGKRLIVPTHPGSIWTHSYPSQHKRIVSSAHKRLSASWSV